MVACALCGHRFRPEGHIRWTKDGFDIVRCPSCALTFRSEPPTEEDLAEIYDDGYFRSDSARGAQGYLDYTADADAHSVTACTRLKLLERYVSPSRLLDVGAAAGFFVHEASRRGWDAAGVDVSARMVHWGVEHLHAALEFGTLQSIGVEAGTLDVITMWDYIEHSLDPMTDVRRALDLLRPGGLLAVSTGDVETLVARLSGSRWHLLTPRHHNFFFSARTLSALLDRAGYVAVYTGHPGARYPLRYIVHKLGTTAPLPFLGLGSKRLASTRLGAVSVRLNLGDIVTIIARKRAEESSA